MALGNSVENSINSPWMMQSLIHGETGGSDVCVLVCGSNNNWTVVVGCMCTGAVLLVVLVIAGRLEVDICSEVAESISSASDGLFAGISVTIAEGVLSLC